MNNKKSNKYNFDKKDGNWLEYNPEGTLIKTMVYSKGDLKETIEHEP